jgi:4-hydroxy-tetrahydrodipicolinate reductase
LYNLHLLNLMRQPLRIALVGHGTMGQEIERLAAQVPSKAEFDTSGKFLSCQIQQIFTSSRTLHSATTSSTESSVWNFDIAIDFSTPQAVEENVRILADRGKSVVIGTTGWSSSASALRQYASQAGIGVVWGTNFSIGVQMFAEIVRCAAQLAERFEEYDIALHEWHHRRKRDSPSGTALTLAEIILEQTSRKTELLAERSPERIATEQLHVSSTRVGDTPGTHIVYIDSAADTLELIHRARTRTGFALGALRAAHWLHGKQGWYEFSEVFTALLSA